MSSGSARVAGLISALKNHARPAVETAQDLKTLKELSRNKTDASALYSQAGMSLMLYYSFEDHSKSLTDIGGEAKRCLANALTLEDKCVGLFCEDDGLEKAVDSIEIRSQTISFNDEFLYARIFFLITGKSGASIERYLSSEKKQELATVINAWLRRHELWLRDCQMDLLDQKLLALTETLKLCFNISMFLPEMLNTTIPGHNLRLWSLSLIDLVRSSDSTSIRAVLPHLINLLVARAPVDTIIESSRYVGLLDTLDEFTQSILQRTTWHGLSITDDQMIPLLSVLSNLQLAYKDDKATQLMLKERLLVPATERNVPLGQSNSSQARILKLINSGSMQVREGLAALLYQISGSSPSKFVENIGYGHAIGVLTSHGLAVPPEKIPLEYAGEAINPVTGQNIRHEADEARRALEEMTDEEKEREAEKLFVLFQRLKKNGVINVKDPIQEAVNSGRFEEI